jgi:hypothetical protein
MSFENFNLESSGRLEDLNSGQEGKNRLGDLLWKKITDEGINDISDISPDELPALYVAAEIFSQPSNLHELTDGAFDWQIAKAEKLIHQLLCNGKRVAKKEEPA